MIPTKTRLCVGERVDFKLRGIDIKEHRVKLLHLVRGLRDCCQLSAAQAVLLRDTPPCHALGS